MRMLRATQFATHAAPSPAALDDLDRLNMEASDAERSVPRHRGR